MHPTCSTSFVVKRGSVEHLYCGYLDSEGFFAEAQTTCHFQEFDPEILEPTELPPIKVTLTQQSYQLAHPVPWFIPQPWCKRSPDLQIESLRDVSPASATIRGRLQHGGCHHGVRPPHLRGAAQEQEALKGRRGCVYSAGYEWRQY